MNKYAASEVLGCDPTDVDSILRIYNIHPIGSVNGRGGWYFDGVVRKVAEYERYKAKLEAELTRKINQEIAAHPLGTMLLMRQIAKDLAQSEDAPTTPTDCLRKFIEKTEV